MNHEQNTSVVQCGREFNAGEIEHIRDTVALFPCLARSEIAETLCEHFSWFTASGGPKRDACLKLLKRLDSQGALQLPEMGKRGRQKAPVTSPALTEKTRPQPEVAARLADCSPVTLDLVSTRQGRELFSEYVERYHYLGYKKPFGCHLRYFVASSRGLLGCILLAGAAKEIGHRDRWIGWTATQRLRNLPLIVNNIRYALFPWIRVKNLASHILGQLSRQVGDDWSERWGYRPVLLETFVDGERFSGTCYRAAGWRCLGQTTGEGLRRKGRNYTTTPKLIYVRPLTDNFRSRLCSSLGPGTTI